MACSPGTISALFWRKKVYCSYNKSFLDGLYLLAFVKHMCLSVCNRYVLLLASSFYLVDALPSELWSRIELIWAYRDYFSNIITLLHSYPGWFVNTLLFI